MAGRGPLDLVEMVEGFLQPLAVNLHPTPANQSQPIGASSS
jgi:hypothetical protein